MIEIDTNNQTYVCPYCGRSQAYYSTCDSQKIGFYTTFSTFSEQYNSTELVIYSLRCTAKSCSKISVVAFTRVGGKQYDIIPECVCKHYPTYIPQQIRSDYEEANLILDKSPKAAATLLRRCLQGMIRDFWGVAPGTLNKEIEQIKDKVTPQQWRAIDSLRHIGNIGAHMEKDVNLIIDVEPDEAQRLLRLIELLLEKWYIARHDEEALCAEIGDIWNEKHDEQKKQVKS